MTVRQDKLGIMVDQHDLAATLASPSAKVPGVLFVHGWGGSQELARAHQIASLGCVCLTFDLLGHGATSSERETVTREQNLRDLVAAYDTRVSQPSVQDSAVAVVGSSYGGYLAAVLSTIRPVKWLALRVPALYEDADWHTPKMKLDRQVLMAYRRGYVAIDENRALRRCDQWRCKGADNE